MENDITASSGNVFEDLGFKGSDAENLHVRTRWYVDMSFSPLYLLRSFSI